MGWIKVKIIGLNPWQDFQALLHNMAFRQRIKDEPCKTVFTATRFHQNRTRGEIFIVLFVSLVAYMFDIRPVTRVAYQLVLSSRLSLGPEITTCGILHRAALAGF